MCLFVHSVQPCVPLWSSKEFCCWVGKGELRCSYPVWQGEMQDLFHGVSPVSGTDLAPKAALILKFCLLVLGTDCVNDCCVLLVTEGDGAY